MKRYLIIGMLICPCILNAQRLQKGLHIPEVTIYGKRPMKDIGVQQTRLDSTVLKENIALSIPFQLTCVCEGEVPLKETVESVARP